MKGNGPPRHAHEDEGMARRRVHQAKVDLGERGPPWGSDPAPGFAGKRIENTPYAGSRGSRRGDPGGAGSRGAG